MAKLNLEKFKKGQFKKEQENEDHFMKAMEYGKKYINEAYSGKEKEEKLKEIDDSIKEWNSLNHRL